MRFRLRICSLLLLLPSWVAGAETFKVGIVEFHGLGNIPRADALAAMTIAEGATFNTADLVFIRESEQRLAALSGVRAAKVELVCCAEGNMIVWAGVQRTDAPELSFRQAPTGDALLEQRTLDSVRRFLEALPSAIRSGRGGEDYSYGHALAADPAMRAEQQEFIAFARDPAPLRHVLRTSSNAEHRAAAAQVIAYTERKAEVVPDLIFAIDDPDEGVRNNALRALGVMAMATQVTPPHIPAQPFVKYLYSPTWTDLNKVSMLMEGLTLRRDPRVLAQLRSEAMQPLIEMARWKSHALPSLRILGRIAGMPENDIGRAYEAGEAERVIQAALAAE